MQIDESKLPSKKTLVKVKRLIQSISEETVRKIDNSLTPFYLWVCTLCSINHNYTSYNLVQDYLNNIEVTDISVAGCGNKHTKNTRFSYCSLRYCA